ncbi:DUF7504 family protein [Haloarcula nitratireducens]|uniref:Recombinase RecA n=1 Tax=Haloarcula nitratireducens TaxID=2487749 RepID=A0AAW4P9W3_9EURY|nr:recombinase RecA [Halomicroarcula nitratireducens]MBX0294593.1 recombinase RecA [Halomicroarcula nitratireducens]
MYDLGPRFTETSVEPGANLLLRGPPLTGKRQLATEILAAGAATTEGTVVVSTRHSAERIRTDYRTLFDEPAIDTVGIVDAVTRHRGHAVEPDGYTKYVSSPRDLTELGVKFAEFVRSYYVEGRVERMCAFLDSLTTLLLYTTLQTVFRFTHVFASRVENADALGLYTIESTVHDGETLDALTKLFDGTITVDNAGTATLSGAAFDDRTVDL